MNLDLKKIFSKELGWLTIFGQSFVATAGSLYYSTFGDPIKNFKEGVLVGQGQALEPCLLCWYARILMYPIVIISIVGIWRKDPKFTDYVLPLSVMGVILELYHYSIQMWGISDIFGCSALNPCANTEIKYLGFITIPLLCLVAFLLIAVLSAINSFRINRK